MNNGSYPGWSWHTTTTHKPRAPARSRSHAHDANGSDALCRGPVLFGGGGGLPRQRLGVPVLSFSFLKFKCFLPMVSRTLREWLGKCSITPTLVFIQIVIKNHLGKPCLGMISDVVNTLLAGWERCRPITYTNLVPWYPLKLQIIAGIIIYLNISCGDNLFGHTYKLGASRYL